MIAYTGIETISNLVRGGARPAAGHPALDPARRDRRLRHLLHAAADRALGAAGAQGRTASTRRCSASRPSRAASRTTRCSGSSRTSACTAPSSTGSRSTSASSRRRSCFVATNAGVIGASRITYAMASYRQLPEVFRRLHPTLQDAVARARRLRRVRLDRGHPARARRTSSATMYAFGAMLSFTIAHASVVALRVKGPRRGARLPRAPEPPAPRDRLAAVRDPRRPRHRGRVARDRRPGAGDALVGLGWLAVGFVVYALYRRRVCTCRCARPSARRRSCSGSQVEYRTILVPVLRTAESEEALVAAARLASRAQGADRHPPRARGPARPAARRRRSPSEERGRRSRSLDEAQALARDLRVRRRSRAGSCAHAARAARSSTEAARREAEVIVIGAPRTEVKGGKPIFGAHRRLRAAKRADAGGGRRRQAGRVSRIGRPRGSRGADRSCSASG